MDARGCLIVCLCVCVGGCGVLGDIRSGNEGHGSICRSNERFLSCGGCQKTCQDPAPDCKSVCRTGCYCNEDEVRNETGHCVKLAECPPVAPAKLQSSEPRHTDFECPADEEYRSCEPCNKTCDNPNPVCPAQCARGCFCRDDLVRDTDGRCVKLEDCSNFKKKESSNLLKPLPTAFQPTCGPHEVYNPRQNCERTCSSATPVCRDFGTPCFCVEDYLRAPDGQCVKPEDCPKANLLKPLPIAFQPTCGPHQVYNPRQNCERTCSSATPVCSGSTACFCQEDYLRAPDGQCVKLADCPKAEVSYGEAHEPTIEDCSSDEVYLSCGWCEPSCWDPKPECPRGVCTRGCLCRPPLLRHHSGHCVNEHDCTPQKCVDPNEEYVCRYGCEARCDFRKCLSRPRRCVLGCHCRLGLYRNPSGKCVPLDHCHLYDNTTNANNHSLFNSSANESSKYLVISHLEADLDPPKSVFGPIPEEFDTIPLPEASKSEDEENAKPYKDVISRAVKLYKELIGNPSHTYTYDTNLYVPRAVKGMSPRTYRDDNGMITKEGLKANDVGNSQFFVNQESKPLKDANVKNYMSDLISAMKEMMPPMYFTVRRRREEEDLDAKDDDEAGDNFSHWSLAKSGQ